LKNPAKSNKRSSGTKQIFIIGGALMTILYFQKYPEKINNLKGSFMQVKKFMICHCDQNLETIYKKIISCKH